MTTGPPTRMTRLAPRDRRASIVAARSSALAGKNGEAVKKAIAGVKLIPVDWTQVMAKKPVWIERWKKDVIGSSGKQLDVVKPK